MYLRSSWTRYQAMNLAKLGNLSSFMMIFNRFLKIIIFDKVALSARLLTIILKNIFNTILVIKKIEISLGLNVCLTYTWYIFLTFLAWNFAHGSPRVLTPNIESYYKSFTPFSSSFLFSFISLRYNSYLSIFVWISNFSPPFIRRIGKHFFHRWIPEKSFFCIEYSTFWHNQHIFICLEWRDKKFTRWPQSNPWCHWTTPRNPKTVFHIYTNLNPLLTYISTTFRPILNWAAKIFNRLYHFPAKF